MRRLREQGRGVIFISHKLDEVLEICDDIVVLRDGEVAGRRSAYGASKADLAHMMVGRDVTTTIEKPTTSRAARCCTWSSSAAATITASSGCPT